VKGDPKPDTRLHGGETFTQEAAQQTQIARLTHAPYRSHGID